MRCLPSKRNLDLVTFLDQGNSLHETAAHFFLKPTEVLRIETSDQGLYRSHRGAGARSSRFDVARADRPVDVCRSARPCRTRHSPHLPIERRYLSRSDVRTEDRSCAAEEIVKLAAERGIEIKGALPPRRTATVDPPRQWLRKAPALSARDPIGMGVRSAADKLGAISIRSSIDLPARRLWKAIARPADNIGACGWTHARHERRTRCGRAVPWS